MSFNNILDTAPVYEILVNDKFITNNDLAEINDFSSRTELSFVKIALTFGYISRKNYERSLINAGYQFANNVRDEAFDENVLSKLDLKYVCNFLPYH